MEKTLIILKPDAVAKGLENDIVQKYEKAGLRMIRREELVATAATLKQHYSAHVQKGFYPSLEKFMSSGKIVAIIFEGNNAVATARKVTGSTDPMKAEKGTIRNEFGDMKLADDDRIMKNLVHASATKEEAEKEIKLWFG
ncbi:MAG: nucleoside-diphosphate kinase [Candidatus Aenigmarchaeota archaeon]|nr:nucleoside-diphosphate kinase [Candidatus Aenigmarchaeota archaeon]